MSTYDEKIKILMICFDISEDCAKYMYFRRKRGVPWYAKDHIKYLEWTFVLQNGLIALDKMQGVDWNKLYFGNEEREFIRYGIVDIDNRPAVSSNLRAKYIIEDNDGFSREITRLQLLKDLNKMGFLPKKLVS